MRIANAMRTLARGAVGPLTAVLTAACVTPHAVATSPVPLEATAADSAGDAGTRAFIDATPEAPEAAPLPEAPATKQELPRGGRSLFPEYRLVGYCGTPGAPALGELQGNLKVKAKALEAKAAQYAQSRKILPVFELIAVVVQGFPGPDGKYRHRVDDSVVDDYLRAARASKAILLLNIQPGQSDFLTELKTFDRYLHEPDVGVALDPEWAMKPKQRPGQFFGQTTSQMINDVAAYLSAVVQQDDLPEKALVYHEVVRTVVKDERDVKPHPGVAIIKSVDGLGRVGAKMATYANLVETTAPGVHAGFKLFFDEDTRNGSRIMTPKEVLKLSPQPEYVMYE